MRSLLARITEIVAPARLGRSFRWLLSATVINNVGDGIAISAGPLLVASQTRDAFLVSMALLSEYLPVLLFGVLGGAIADRVDRRRMVVFVNLGRSVVLVPLVATIVSGNVNIAVVLVALFVLGTAETFADSGSSTLLPGPVVREDLGIAKAEMSCVPHACRSAEKDPHHSMAPWTSMGSGMGSVAPDANRGAILRSVMGLPPRLLEGDRRRALTLPTRRELGRRICEPR